MDTKKTIRKVGFIALWLCIGAGMLMLLLAAINKKNKGVCKGYSIVLKGAQHHLFIDEKEVEQILKKETGGNIKGEAIASFKLNDLSKALQKNTWISAAELYFDNKDLLHITITEKEPVARIFTVGGHSFYLDSAANKMPLSDKLSARLPVFTGFIDAKKLTNADSNLLKEVTVIANYILKDSFWMAQVAQLDITPERNFEMIPLVGNHIVKLGNGQDVDRKFRRLMVFYRQVLSKTGFDKYKTIDVQYAGQIVASKNVVGDKVDAAQLKNNIQKLIKQSAEVDTAVRIVKPIAPLEADDEIPTDETLKDNNASSPAQQNPNTMKLSLPATDNDGKKKREAESKPPKAVMHKRTTTASANGDRGYN